MAAFEPVTSVLRAFEVLRIINERDHATVTEIHRLSGLPKPTILRMIETLIAAGYVARENDRPAYVATGKCLLLSNGFRIHDRLTAVAAPMLAAFRRKIGWPSDFCSARSRRYCCDSGCSTGTSPTAVTTSPGRNRSSSAGMCFGS